MAWNAPPNQANNPPHPPPPYGGPQGIWEFMRSLNLDNGSPEAGAGVDHTMPSAAPPTGFPFAFGPSGGGAGPDISFNPWFGGWPSGGRRGRRHGAGRWGFGPDEQGSDHDHHDHHGRHGRHGSRHGGHGRGGRHRGRHSHTHTPSETEDDLFDITSAATVAEAEILDNLNAEKNGPTTPTPGAATATADNANAGEHPDPPEEIPSASTAVPPGRCGRRGRFGERGRGGPCGRRGFARHFGPAPPFPPPPHHADGSHPPPPLPPFFRGSFGAGRRGGPGSIDWTGIANNFANYMREYWQSYAAGQESRGAEDPAAAGDDDAFVDGEETFAPPADVFATPTGWTIHLAIPGAKKQDVGVHWDGDRSVLVVSGVVYRPGDEEFLQGMISGERKVGLFERKIELPPKGAAAQNEKGEVDGDKISAKLEDGVLTVVVGKLEKEWTEIKKVDIE